MTIAAEFAKTRYTLGVPISTLQGISHPLANMAITVQGGRGLARRAAWYLDNEPGEAARTGPVGVRVHGRGGRRRPPPWPCTFRADLAFRRRPPRARTWCGPGDGRWPAAIPVRPPSRSAASSSARESQIGGQTTHGLLTGCNCPTTIRRSSTRRAPSSTEQVTEDVIRRDRETGDNFDEGVHLALGAAGYLDGGVEHRGRWRLRQRAPPTVAAGEAPLPTCRG